ncbi:MAG: hypothetical protein MUF11_07755 [Beijerinckiaceae bacterium]|nr:hypothetical protein [Beijerinckiaceae bacterium]
MSNSSPKKAPSCPSSLQADLAPLTTRNPLVNPAKGTHRVIVYAAGSRGLINFARPLGIPLYKIGVTSSQDPQRRVEDLRRKGYAALWGRPGQPMDQLTRIPQGHEWCLSPFRMQDLEGALPAGFALVDGHLEIEVPFKVTVEAIDRAVHALLRRRSLEQYLASEEGQLRLVQSGLDPAGQLLTRYTLMTRIDRISAVEELYLIRPQRDLGPLVRGLARALAPLMARGHEQT